MKKYILLVGSFFLLFSCFNDFDQEINTNTWKTQEENKTWVYVRISLSGKWSNFFNKFLEDSKDLEWIFPKNGERQPVFTLVFDKSIHDEEKIVSFIEKSSNYVTKDYFVKISISKSDIQEILDSKSIFDAISKLKSKRITFILNENQDDKIKREYLISQDNVKKILSTDVETTYDISSRYNSFIYFLDENWEKKSLIYKDWKAKYFTNQSNTRLYVNKLIDMDERKIYERETWWEVISK